LASSESKPTVLEFVKSLSSSGKLAYIIWIFLLN
jgi:hypothetical protein